MKVNNLYSKYISENYLALLSNFKEKKTRDITTLVLTLIAVSFLAVFAINPTLSTIAKLKKQLADNQFVEDALVKKIENLSVLRKKYNSLQNRLPVVFSAIPKSPNNVNLMAEIQTMALDSNVEVGQLQVGQTDLAGSTSQFNSPNTNSFIFFISVRGTYNDIVKFVNSLTSFDRIITIDSLSINKSSKTSQALLANIRAKAYYMK
ncbi:type 4a pilus biogenesis protein PilO [Patescibacteria group bacterium]|nr:type 4a pilus biogenesis protein PilO [Patescibacteria group bacterium]MCL5010046.1 type 4a pilus biogenesis protein PilO [Patescibacteria group bacterium]